METRRRVRADLGLAEEDLVVASVGRLVEQKDYPTQLRGFAEAARQEQRLRMLLVGDGPLRASLQSLTAELGIGSRVSFIGYRSDVAQVLQAADFFTLTSVFEPLGIAVLEAKANGTPILASAVNEIPRLLDQGRSGRLFEAGSVSGYAAQLLGMARDPALCAGLARHAYEEAREKHSLAAMIEGYQRLYDEILPAVHR
jgi:glycosyltransferase involved in cell wall biosynthesis